MPQWKTISLPEEMLNEIKKFIEEHPEYGYSSVAEFVTTAVRAYRDYRNLLENKLPEKQPSEQKKDQYQ